MLESVFFFLFATLATVSAVMVVRAQSAIYAVLSLLLTMLALAGIFVLLHAYFVAIIHLLVYAGAILVLFLFVVMLLGVDKNQRALKVSKGQALVGLLIGIGLFLELLQVKGTFLIKTIPSSERLVGTIEAIGTLLFQDYVLPFELTSILLLVGIIGAVVLAKKETS